MKKNMLLRTNGIVCAVIIIGFVITSMISYQSNQEIFRKDIESVSKLTSEGIYHQIDSIFIKPVNISLTMANDSLLMDFLEEEQLHTDDPAFTETMRAYLNTYREKYGYDSVFLASAKTRRYYYFNGLDRTLEEDDPENGWFYDFLGQDVEQNIVIDNDQVAGAGNEITVFINCRITNSRGQTLGLVGVGFRVDSLQALLKSYENDFGVKAYLTDKEGNIEISTDRTGYDGKESLFENCDFPELKESLLSGNDSENLWYQSSKGSGYVVGRFIENLGWYLTVENDTTAIDQALAWQFTRQFFIVLLTILAVLLTISTVLHWYDKKVLQLAHLNKDQHQAMFQQATEQLYENIYEIDISHNRSASESTSRYFESLGAPPDIPYDKALRVIAEKQIKEEYRQGYIDTFSPRNVLKAFKEGNENLRYDFMITNDGGTYYWMRIIAHIFRWWEDDSVRMLVYRQNIDEQKRREAFMMEQMQLDSLTGLYNKAATQEHVHRILKENPGGSYAFYILDIDHFKGVNDHLGHAAGDEVLVEFARILKEQFRKEDIVGRIGGDEFVAFMSVPGRDLAQERARALTAALRRRIEDQGGAWEITVSIGVALAPEAGTDFETLYRRADKALYQAKEEGRDRFAVIAEK